MKKTICLLLSLVCAFSFLSLSASSIVIVDDIPFEYNVYSEKDSYALGEDVFIHFDLENNSLDEICDVRFWMDYPLTEYFLTPGVSEYFVESFTESVNYRFRVKEDEGVLDFASKFSGSEFITGLLLKLAHKYKDLTLWFTTLRYGFQHAFVSFGQKQVDLGTVKALYNGTEMEFTVKCRYSVKKSVQNELIRKDGKDGKASADIMAVSNSYTGLAFACEDQFNYGLFLINPDYSCAYIYKVEDGKYHFKGIKKVNIDSGKKYHMDVVFESGRVICHLFDNPSDRDPYPVFDMYYDSSAAGYGVYCGNDGYSGFGVEKYSIPRNEKEYINPVCGNSADPYILMDNGIYYLYATTSSSWGFSVRTSTDLVNWKDGGTVAKKGDIFGNDKFWAPEVYPYNGKYYLLYSTDEYLAIASASSPMGPFVKCSDSYIFDHHGIDGHLFLDDDGKYYLYFAYFGDNGSEIYGCRFNMDTCTADTSTLTQLTVGKEDEHGVNEGPFMLKYKGSYYLTYSVNGYESQDYQVRLAVSGSPLGKYESRGTILIKSGEIVGTGHHSFITSADGNELFITYHCHKSLTEIHDRKLCIDRCKFVSSEKGYTISVYGPTSTPQPYPTEIGGLK